MNMHQPTRRWLAAGAAAALALGVASQGSSFATPAPNSPFNIDGTVPTLPPSLESDAEVTTKFTDDFGNASELGPVNASSTKLGVIHTDATPTLGYTNPNSQVDLRNVWIGSAKDSTDDEDTWLYFGWERDSNKGSGVIMYEFQQSPEPEDCDYALPLNGPALIADCNPFENRQVGDFVVVWDQSGSSAVVKTRFFELGIDVDGDDVYDKADGDTLVLGGDVPLAVGTWQAQYSSDKFRGEGTLNLTDTIFAKSPGSCLTIGNVIPGTVTGNSDTADYKDVVLADVAESVAISSCGSVTVTKKTLPDPAEGQFGYTLERDGGDALDYDEPPMTERTGTLTEDGDTETQFDLIAADDYTLSEQVGDGTPYSMTSIVCTVGEGEAQETFDVSGGELFMVEVGGETQCLITNTADKVNLTLVKEVDNGNGGTTPATAWALTATNSAGTNVINAAETGTPGATVETDAGTFVLSETGPGGYEASDWVCTGTGSQSGNEITLGAGQNATCTITNDDIQPTLTLVKEVSNDNDGGALATDWALTATHSDGTPVIDGVATGTTTSVNAGTYDLSESGGPSGYTASDWDCVGGTMPEGDGDTVTLGVGQNATCTITNDDVQPRLTLVKQVTNDNDGGALATDWALTATHSGGAKVIDGATTGTDAASKLVNSGTYDLSESGGPTGYTASDWDCVGGTMPEGDGDTVTVGPGQNATCTITNDDVQPRLTLVKQVTNDDGGNAAPTEWVLTATSSGGTKVIDGATTGTDAASKPVNSGTYDLSESGGPSGYTASDWDCVGGTMPEGDGDSVTLAAGESATCTITNDDQPAGLTLVKEVINDDGGNAPATAWALTAKDSNGVPVIDGAESGSPEATKAVDAGRYDLSEVGGPSGYTDGTVWECVGGTMPVDDPDSVILGEGEGATCTITNDDQPAQLKLVKVVTNNNGGEAVTTDWTLSATGPTPLSGAGGAEGAVDAGAYTLSESGGPDGYTATVWTCVGGTQTGSASVSLGIGESATCTITNDDDKASPTGTTTQRWVLHDALTISGLREGAEDAAAATATFTLYEGTVCTTVTEVDSEVVAVTGTTVTTEDGIEVLEPGEYRWMVTYSGDTFNAGFTTACTEEITRIQVKDFERDTLGSP